MQDLGARTVLSRSRVSCLVDELEGQALVERLRDPDDGRACLAHLTPRGRAALKRAAPRYLQGIQTHFARHLDADELQTITEALERVVATHDSR